MRWTSFAISESGTEGWHAGTGEALALVLHGGPGLSDYTETLADEVLDAGGDHMRVVRYEQRRHPSRPGALTIADLVEQLFGVLDHFAADVACIVGHSWGGHLAMHAAVARPQRIAGLLLVDSLGATGDGGAGGMDEVIAGRIGERARADLVSLAASELPAEEKAMLELRLVWPGYFSDPSAAPPMPPITYDANAAAAIMAEAVDHFERGVLERVLPSLDVPSLHLIGRLSPIDPTANERTAALMPGSMTRMVDTGHFVWIERPGVVRDATRELLARIATQTDSHAWKVFSTR